MKMEFKQNKVFGLVSVIAKNSSWNSDFNHSPKKYDDTFFASDRALKYAVRNLMEQMGKKLLIKKWVKGIKDDRKVSMIDVMTSNELKKSIKEEYGKDFNKMFWEFEDVRQFGMVYDGIGIHGPVQISQGIDKYGLGVTYEDDLTGRMVFESKADSSKETRGMASREFLTEAHYIYDFSVNPKNVAFLKEIEGYESFGYTEDDFETLLEGLQYGPANVKSTQKLNCFTGFMMYVEMNDGENTLLSNLQGKIKLESEKLEEDVVVYDISNLVSYLKNKQDAAGQSIYKKIQVVYEKSEVEIKGLNEINESDLSNVLEVEVL